MQMVVDPWFTEGKLFEAQTLLLRAQRSERTYLAAAFGLVEALEEKRVQTITAVLSSFLQTYK